MLKSKPRIEQTYEQIKRAITILPFGKRLTPRKTVKKSVINTRSKQLKNNDLTSNFPKDLKQDTKNI